MKRTMTLLLCVLAISLAGTGAHAACSVKYKAKRDNPLKLFHGTATVAGPCKAGTVSGQLRAKLASQGLTLLKVLSVRKK